MFDFVIKLIEALNLALWYIQFSYFINSYGIASFFYYKNDLGKIIFIELCFHVHNDALFNNNYFSCVQFLKNILLCSISNILLMSGWTKEIMGSKLGIVKSISYLILASMLPANQTQDYMN